jgi:hypothetical protein
MDTLIVLAKWYLFGSVVSVVLFITLFVYVHKVEKDIASKVFLMQCKGIHVTDIHLAEGEFILTPIFIFINAVISWGGVVLSCLALAGVRASKKEIYKYLSDKTC